MIKNKASMTEPDFQKLLALVLADLTIRRTLCENRVAEVNQQLRSLEKDAELEALDQQITALQADYDHYHAYVDPAFHLDLEQYYQGLK